jgi:head-tail adaptor
MTVAVRTGSLRHRITFKKYTRTTDAIGGNVRTLTTVCMRWGRIKPTTGYEPFISDNLKTVISHTAEMRTIPAQDDEACWFWGPYWGKSVSGTGTVHNQAGWFAGEWWGAFENPEETKIQAMLFFYKTRMFKIHGVLRPEEQQGLITLLCEEVVE